MDFLRRREKRAIINDDEIFIYVYTIYLVLFLFLRKLEEYDGLSGLPENTKQQRPTLRHTHQRVIMLARRAHTKEADASALLCCTREEDIIYIYNVLSLYLMERSQRGEVLQRGVFLKLISHDTFRHARYYIL